MLSIINYVAMQYIIIFEMRYCVSHLFGDFVKFLFSNIIPKSNFSQTFAAATEIVHHKVNFITIA